MLNQHKKLSTFLVLAFIFAVFQLLSVLMLLNKPVRRALPENNLAFERYPSIIEPTPELDLASLLREDQMPIGSDAPGEATFAIPTATLDHTESKKEGATLSEPLTAQNTTAAYSNQPDHLVIYTEESSSTHQSIAKTSPGCAKMLEQSADNALGKQLCIELYHDDGDQVADSISDRLVSFSLLSNNSSDDAVVYEFTNLSAGHYFAIFYQFNQQTWQTAFVEATPTEKGYMVRFWQAKKKPQAPSESLGVEASSEDTKVHHPEVNAVEPITDQETEEINEWASEESEANNYSEVNSVDNSSSQVIDEWTAGGNSAPEPSNTATITIEEPDEWSSEVEVNSYPAPTTNDETSQEGTTQWHYENYSEGDFHQWSWWEENSEE